MGSFPLPDRGKHRGDMLRRPPYGRAAQVGGLFLADLPLENLSADVGRAWRFGLPTRHAHA
ncbi:hypothetical protein Pth03_78080 [Planotetraspora thailandica]|uniref:Uncharacterized protein n=1 Tax=Planotetraspora thailandica TaxID=487172 RepID=A0A8J3Y293_9ACTN|nr:hypothetical protein Pth03_78080 [Planotetraspora thailandica]